MRSSSATGLVLLTLSITFSMPSPARSFCFEQAAARYNIAPEIIRSISKKENPKQNPRAVNYNTDGSYDYGLMQINTCHAEDLRKAGIPWESLSDPCMNVMVGSWLLSQAIQKYGYTWKAIGAYHSKTPSKRDRYARDVAKILFNKTPVPVATQQRETKPNLQGKNDGPFYLP